MAAKKPNDETLRGAPDFGTPPLPASINGAKAARPSLHAPEVSQGAWREKLFAPRAVMPAEQVISGLETVLHEVLTRANLPAVAYQEVRSQWLPFLRQALEQSGGDGVDAWLSRVLTSPGRRAMDPLLDDLIAQLARLRGARDLAQFEEEALKATELVRRAYGLEQPRKLSFKTMEKDLEGKLNVDELLVIACSDDNELSRRLTEVGRAMEQLRDQIRSRPGEKPAGMFMNFTRLKAEMRVLDGELKRRQVKTAP